MGQMLYLRLDGVDGEEPIGDNSQDAIAIIDYQHSLGRDLAAQRGSVGADAYNRRSMVMHAPFVVNKALDKSSTRLFAAAAHGVVFKHAVVYACSQEISSLTKKSTQSPFLSIVLTDAVIVDFSYGFAAEWQTERIAFQYSSIGWDLDWKDPESGDDKTLEPVGWEGKENKVTEISIPSSVEWSSGLLG